MNSFRARLDGSPVEAKNHLASDLISASPLRRSSRRREEEEGNSLSLVSNPESWHGFASLPNDKNPISSGTVAWKEGHDAFLPSRMGGGGQGKRETLIEPIKCRRKLPTSRESVVESAPLWETFVESRPNFPDCWQAAFEFEFFPLGKEGFRFFLPFDFNYSSCISGNWYLFYIWFSSGMKLEWRERESNWYFSEEFRTKLNRKGFWSSRHLTIFEVVYVVSFSFILLWRKKERVVC